MKATIPSTSCITTTAAHEMTWHGRRLVSGQEVTVILPPRSTGTRCTFIALMTGPSGRQWVDVMTMTGRSRSVHLDAIKTVHNRKDN